MTDTAPERNFNDTHTKSCVPRLRAGHRRRIGALLALGLSVCVCSPLPAQPLVLLVQAPVWDADSVEFEPRLLAERLSAALGRELEVQRSDDVLSHWRRIRAGRGFDLVLDEAHFTAWRAARHGFTVLAQAQSEVRFAIVVRPRTLITAPSDLSALRVAAPAPPALAALRLMNLFPDSVQAPILVVVPGRDEALLALSQGRVSAAIVPMEAAEALSGVQIALETDASPGRAFSVSRAISPSQRRALIALFRELGASAPGRRILSSLALTRLEPVTGSVYEDSERLLKGTWGYLIPDSPKHDKVHE